MLKTLFALLACFSLFATPLAQACDTCGCKDAKHEETHAAGAEHTHDIVDTAIEAGDFTTLVAAVQAAGLVETLKGEGPFTVFAPNDKAFEKIDSATLQSLLTPEKKKDLTAILTYHVVPGKVMAADVVNLTEAKTVNGARVSIEVVDGAVMVDGAKVTATDIACENGVIHVIDTVLMP